MMALSTLALATCLAVPAASDHVVARDLAPASAAFAGLPADTVLTWAPEPGVRRALGAAELRRLAARFGATPPPDADLCIERPAAPLDRERVQAFLQAQLPDARLEIAAISRQPAPEGTLVFPLESLRRGRAEAYWSGYGRYAGNRRFPVWAIVNLRGPVVVAAEDLSAGRPVEAAKVRVEMRDGFPQPDFFAATVVVHAGLQLLFDFLQFGPQPLGNRLAFDREGALPGRSAAMRKTQEVERLRLAQTPLRTSFRRITAELDEPGFLRV